MTAGFVDWEPADPGTLRFGPWATKYWRDPVTKAVRRHLRPELAVELGGARLLHWNGRCDPAPVDYAAYVDNGRVVWLPGAPNAAGDNR